MRACIPPAAVPSNTVRRYVVPVVVATMLTCLIAPFDRLFAQASPPAEETLVGSFEAAMLAEDMASLQALLADDARFREGGAILGADAGTTLSWVAECLTGHFALERDSRVVTGSTVSWRVLDSTDCYWRSHPNALRPSWNVLPVDGTLEMQVRDGKIAQLKLTYSAMWEHQLYAAQAAPIRTAQAQATAWAQPTHAAATATAVHAAEATRVADLHRPAATDTQLRTRPSVLPWGIALVVTGMAALLSASAKPDRWGRRKIGRYGNFMFVCGHADVVRGLVPRSAAPAGDKPLHHATRRNAHITHHHH